MATCKALALGNYSEFHYQLLISYMEFSSEPYRFDMLPHFDTTILAQYEHDGKLWPAAWAHEYGLGRVVYLINGHQLSCFSVQPFRQLIKQAGLWAAAAGRVTL